ncbi:MAG: RagB/SusD family nutrient uptake outer membrane protein, partial [Saprospiraceae bacterium]
MKYLIISTVILALASCNIDDLANPNGSSIEGFSQNASKSELQTLVTGMESLLRQEIGFYYDVTSIIGREYYFFTGSDPRYTGEVLGKGESQLDNNGFYGTRPYFGRYKTVKNANVLI